MGIKGFNRILENLILNASKPVGNKFVIRLDDVNITENLSNYFKLFKIEEKFFSNIAGNDVLIFINGEILTNT